MLVTTASGWVRVGLPTLHTFKHLYRYRTTLHSPLRDGQVLTMTRVPFLFPTTSIPFRFTLERYFLGLLLLRQGTINISEVPSRPTVQRAKVIAAIAAFRGMTVPLVPHSLDRRSVDG